MFKYFSCVGVVFCFVLGTAVSAEAQEVTLTSKARPTYLLMNNGSILYDEPVIQSDVLLSWKSGVYADIWTSTAGNTRQDSDKEVDLILGYGRNLRRFVVGIDGEYFFIQGGDVVNVNFDLIFPTHRLSPFVRVEAYLPRKHGGPRHGVLTSTGLLSNVKIVPRLQRLQLEVKGLVKRDSGCFGYDQATFVQSSVLLKFQVTNRTSLTGGIQMSKPVTSVADGRKSQAVWEVGFSRRFK